VFITNILKTSDMLKKDNQNITKEIAKKFPNEFDLIKGKKQVTFKLVNSIFNGKEKSPRSYSIQPAYATQDDDGDVQEFLYYQSVKKRTIAGVAQDEYSPGLLTFGSRGDFIINLIDADGKLINFDLFILLFNHPRRAKNKYGDGKKRPIFYLEDKNAEAVERVEAESARAQMKKLIYDPEARMKEEDLRTIARALRIPGVDDMNFPGLLQTSIEDACKVNPTKFLQFKGVGKEVQMRANLQKAAEKGVIKHDPLKRKWMLNNTDTGKMEAIAPVRPTENEMEALMAWLKNVDTDDTYGKIMELATGKIQEKAKPKESADAERARMLEAENENLRLKLQLAEQRESTSTDEVDNKPKAKAPGKGKGKPKANAEA
jgi:hypothetical protein